MNTHRDQDSLLAELIKLGFDQARGTGNMNTYRDHDNTIAGLKATYGQHKTYSLRRGELRERVQDLVLHHGLAENHSKGGYVQCTPSIGFGWSVWEHGNAAVMLYRDGGMGWDRVMLMGRDKTTLAELRDTGIILGLVRLRDRVAA